MSMKMDILKNILKSITYCGLSLLVSTAANAQLQDVALRYDIPQENKLALTYDIYAGGFKALNANLELDLDKNAYDMALEAKTQGFIGSIFPWKANYSTSGHAEKGLLIPDIYIARSSWRNKVSTTELSYDPKGKILKKTTQENNKTKVDRNIDQKISADAVDMLTGALLMLQNAKNTNQCKGTFPVFDGKRRFNITLQDAGKDDLKKTRYSNFEGQALRCTLKVEPVAGFKDKDKKRGWMAVQEHTENHNKAPTLWLAKLEKSGPVVPVRMEIASDYGAVVAHLTDASKK